VNDDTHEPGMVKDQITLPDGRYLIYYTFAEDEHADETIGHGPSTA
jgi:hypothetical protein